MIDYKLIIQCPIFKGIPESEIKNLFQKIHLQIKKFNKNEIVVHSGAIVSSLLIILSGSVKGEMIDHSGKTIKIEDVEAPLPLASAFLFGKENKYPVTVTANGEVKIITIPVTEFLKLLQLNSQVLKNYLHSISTRAQFLSQKLHFLSFKTIKEKVSHFLLNKTGDQFHSFELKETQQQLADMFGVTRPSLARVLGEMQQNKLIKIEKRTVKILNKNALNEIIRNGR